jgi:Fe-S cluster assembly iron-binding protein IscA
MALDEPKETDEIVENDGITYMINKELYEQVKPISVDFTESAYGSGFAIRSSLKQASGSGGCGSSCSTC